MPHTVVLPPSVHNLSILFWQESENQPEMALIPDINQPQMEIDETKWSRIGLEKRIGSVKLLKFQNELVGCLNYRC